jgi:3-dehydroquinate dehydratase/shikimate dehydrogenase
MAGSALAQDTTSEKGKLSYYFGYDYGNNLAELQDRGEQVDAASVVKGVQDALAKKQPAITADQLKPALEALSWVGLKGFSVTIPHKEAIIPLLTSIDKSVERIGACNTVVIDGDRRVGHNTDYRAAMATLEEALGGSEDDETSPLLDKQVVVLGAGGVARAVVAGLVRRGAGVTICARNEEKAGALAAEFACRTTSWGMRASTLCDILINCTPVGKHPNVDSTPVPPAGFRPGMLVFDTVYHPENTMMLKLARELEASTVTGVDMFVRQAAMQFKYYTGHEAPVAVMREAVTQKLGAVQE